MVGRRVLLGECIQGARVQISNCSNVCIKIGDRLLDGGGLQVKVYATDMAMVKRSAPRRRTQTWKTCPGMSRSRRHWWAVVRAAARLGAAGRRSASEPELVVSGASTVPASRFLP